MLGKNPIKILLGLKLILLLAVLFYVSESFYIGEKSSIANENGEKNLNTDNNETNLVSENNAKGSDEQEDKKSFLSNLLNLPEISDIDGKNEAIGKYLSLAERKKQQVDQRLALLQEREVQLKKIEATIDDKLSKLEEERRFFTLSIQKEKELKEDRLKKLVDFYSKMEPKKAGPVFEQLDKDLSVALLQNLKQKTITKILESMSPEKSVQLTEYFGRIKSGKEYELLKEMNVSLRESFEECKGMPSH